MHIVHIEMTLHIKVLVYCKKCSYPISYGPTQNLCTPLYTAQRNRWQVLQIKISIMHYTIYVLATFEKV